MSAIHSESETCETGCRARRGGYQLLVNLYPTTPTIIHSAKRIDMKAVGLIRWILQKAFMFSFFRAFVTKTN
jgi:hypothetical protein